MLPDGSRSLIPAAWTDVGAEETVAVASEVLGSLGDLQHLGVVIDGLIHRSRDASRQDRGEDPGEVAGAASTGTGRRGRARRGVGDARGGGSGDGDRTSGGSDGQRRGGVATSALGEEEPNEDIEGGEAPVTSRGSRDASVRSSRVGSKGPVRWWALATGGGNG